MSLLKGVRSEIDVKIEVPIHEGPDVVSSVCFVATFRQMTQKQRQTWRARTAETLRTHPEKHDQSEHVRDWLVGWKDFPGAGGEPVDYTPENLEQVLDAIEYCDSLYAGFLEMVNGTALSKN